MPSLSDLTRSLSRLASSETLRRTWNVLRHAPGGGVLMGQILGNLAPYTGTIRPEVLTLEEGYARVRMRDRRAVRNHLSSVHAIALMNLGEVATGVAMMSALPGDMRGIITHLEMDYLKKARGSITAECRAPLAVVGERREYDVQADLTDEAGEVVARARARWLIGPATH
ncbi:hotdog fold domain-containing protein [Archangium sp.]|jgi:acyl-coenzyme A thioesterase PaaI-like protein|uniref:hotdog fold domain-containing protein n=1 Tax=Archangium sp. TaxID=1872627 RepID=UPI00286BAD33|nr:hotdog fold domain-containing protein [Archangium sp.]